MSFSRHSHHAFTLIELLVVISIVALLIALLLPSLNNARYQAKVVQCSSVLRGIAIGSITYANDNEFYWPTKFDAADGGIAFGPNAITHYRAPWELNVHGTQLTPIYEEYLGGDLDDVMECPLAPPFYSDNNTGSFVSYTVFTVNNHNMKFVKMNEKPGYEKLDATWQPKNKPEIDFAVIASDSALRWNSVSPYATHPSAAGSLGQVGSASNQNQVGWQLGPTQRAPVNFADADGSVRSFTFENGSMVASDWVEIPSDGGKPHYIPRALAK